MNIVIIVLVVAYIVMNLITAKMYNVQEMKGKFIEGQCLVGMVAANIVYSPAWLLKCVRILVLRTIK